MLTVIQAAGRQAWFGPTQNVTKELRINVRRLHVRHLRRSTRQEDHNLHSTNVPDRSACSDRYKTASTLIFPSQTVDCRSSTAFWPFDQAFQKSHCIVMNRILPPSLSSTVSYCCCRTFLPLCLPRNCRCLTSSRRQHPSCIIRCGNRSRRSRNL